MMHTKISVYHHYEILNVQRDMHTLIDCTAPLLIRHVVGTNESWGEISLIWVPIKLVA